MQRFFARDYLGQQLCRLLSKLVRIWCKNGKDWTCCFVTLKHLKAPTVLAAVLKGLVGARYRAVVTNRLQL
jgi:hypothetical protein